MSAGVLATSVGQLAVGLVTAGTLGLVCLLLLEGWGGLRERRHRNLAAAARRGEAWPWWLPVAGSGLAWRCRVPACGCGTELEEVDVWDDRQGAS